MTYESFWQIIVTAVILAGAHFFSDFTKQTPYMALNKSKSNKILTHHVLTQTCWMYLGIVPVVFILGLSYWFLPVFFVCNFTIHFATDWCTSRLTGYFYKREDMRHFLQVIGADQLIHYLTYVFIIAVFMMIDQ